MQKHHSIISIYSSSIQCYKLCVLPLSVRLQRLTIEFGFSHLKQSELSVDNMEDLVHDTVSSGGVRCNVQHSIMLLRHVIVNGSEDRQAAL